MSEITLRDLEALSAHLDGALDEPAAARLQARLAAEPQLRAALGKLEQTRTQLRAAAQRRRPRGFTLSPAMAGALKPAKSSFGGWSLLSAAASLLLVAVLAGQVLPGGEMLTAAQPDAAPQAFMMEMAAEETGDAAEAAGAAAASEPAPDTSRGTAEDEAPPRMGPAPAAKAPAYTLSSEQLLGGLATLAAFSGLMAWRQWRRLPDR